MKNYKPDASVRLEAKKILLEQESRSSIMRLQNNVDHLKSNVPSMAAQEVTHMIEKKNPAIAKAVGMMLPHGGKRETTVERVYRRDMELLSNAESHKGHPVLQKALAIGGALVPVALGFGKRHLMKMGLKGSGNIVKFVLKKLFRRFFK